MEHINETEWDHYLAGLCSPERAAWIDAHVDTCADCTAAMQQALAVHAMLGNWQVNTAGHDITDRLTATIDQISETRRRQRTYRLTRRIISWSVPVAAALLIGISLGHLAGKSSAQTHIAQQQGTVIKTQPHYLAALNLQFASDLTWSVLEDDSTETEAKP